VLTFYAWQCGSAIVLSRGSANSAVRHFHQELNDNQYEQIYLEASEGFSEEGKHVELVKFLEAIHTKLGNAGAERLLNATVNAGTDGTFVTTEYDTTFAGGSAIETFTWIKKRGALKLYGYNVQSNTFLSQ